MIGYRANVNRANGMTARKRSKFSTEKYGKRKEGAGGGTVAPNMYFIGSFHLLSAVAERKTTIVTRQPLQLGLSFYPIFTDLQVKNFYQFTGKFEW